MGFGLGLVETVRTSLLSLFVSANEDVPKNDIDTTEIMAKMRNGVFLPNIRPPRIV